MVIQKKDWISSTELKQKSFFSSAEVLIKVEYVTLQW